MSQENEKNAGEEKKNLTTRLFGNKAYSRLFSAQFVNSLGDWLGLVAITATAAEIGAGSPATAIGLVLVVRLAPGFFLSQLAGVVADRINRRHLMITCDIGRAVAILLVPFSTTVWHLIIISFILEMFTLLWIPAKEAMLPDIITKDRLAGANSLSLVATYGTYPLASGVLLLLSLAGIALENVNALSFLRINETSIAFYVDSLTFLAAAYFIFSMRKWVELKPTPKNTDHLGTAKARSYIKQALVDTVEGLRYIALTPVVRGVNIGFATALIGGGMLIPLGAVFATDVLDAGTGGFAAMQMALGSGVGLGVVILLLLRRYKDLSNENIFIWSTQGAGISLIAAVTFNVLPAVLAGVAVMGIFAGALYVTGFTILHEKVSEDLRGRVFSSLYALVRLSVVFSLAVAPFLSTLIGGIVRTIYGDQANIGDYTYPIPGVRLTLWLAAIVMILAGVISSSSVRSEAEQK